MYNYDLSTLSPISTNTDFSDIVTPCPSPSAERSGKKHREVNLRLTQALNYMHAGGACDSPGTFNDRVELIDQVLVHGLPRQLLDFDAELYSRVQSTVEDIRYKDSQYHFSKSLPREAMNRFPDSPMIATPHVLSQKLNFRKQILTKGSAKVLKEATHEEREFTYGGPGNEPEVWNMSPSASLPSSTISHKTSYCGIEDDHLESGSHFRLPPIRKEDLNALVKFEKWRNLVAEEIYTFNNAGRRGSEKYSPQVCLEEIQIGEQDTQFFPDNIRRSINLTPTKHKGSGVIPKSSPPLPRLIIPGHPQTRTPSSRGSAGPAMRAIKKAVNASLAAEKAFHATKAAQASIPKRTLAWKSVKAATAVVIPPKRVAMTDEDSLFTEDVITDIIPKVSPTKVRNPEHSSCAELDHAPEATFDKTKESSAPVDRTAIDSPAKYIIPEATPGAMHATTMTTPKTNPTPKSQKSAKHSTKRKHSDGSLPYTPGTSAMKKKLRTRKTPAKNIAQIDGVSCTDLDADDFDPSFLRSPALTVETRSKKRKYPGKSPSLHQFREAGDWHPSLSEDADENVLRRSARKTNGSRKVE